MNNKIQKFFSLLLCFLLVAGICSSAYALLDDEGVPTEGGTNLPDPAHLNDGEGGGVEIPTGNTDPTPTPAADPTPTPAPTPSPEVTPVVPAVVTPDIVIPTATPAPTEAPSSEHTPTPTFAPGETPTPSPDTISITKQHINMFPCKILVGSIYPCKNIPYYISSY